MTHIEAGELLGAYALDAVSDDERAELDAHVATCSVCADELARHREIAALIAQTELPAPSGQWNRIAAAISERPQTFSRSTRRPSRTRMVVTAGAAAAVAAAAAALVTFAVVDPEDSDGVEAAARAAASEPGADEVALRTTGGETVVEAVVLPDGRAYVLADSLGALPSGRTYQLWALDGGDPISVGLLGRDPGVRELDVPAGTARLAVTEEDAGGAVQPSGAPVASGAIA